MTQSERTALKKAIDAKTREKLDAETEIATDIVITDSGIEETMDEETLARVARDWKEAEWRLYTTCTQHGEMAWCCGPTRDKVVCLACFIAGPTRTTKGRVMTTATDKPNLLDPFLAATREALPGVDVVVKAAYARVVDGKRTLAYVNGERKLRIEIAKKKPEKGVSPAISVTKADEFAAVIKLIGETRETATTPPAESIVDDLLAGAAKDAKDDGKGGVKPDPKPTKKPRSRSRSNKAATPAA